MGDRRMLTKKVTDDDHFINLSSSAQALYLHLSMDADDDGFCNKVTTAIFKAHASIQDLQALLENRYIYQFDTGVIVIKHWRMANALRKDRYTPTEFQEEFAKLKLKENGAYTWVPDGCQMGANCLPQYNLSQDNLSQDNTPPTPPGGTRAKSGFDKFWKEYPRKVGKEAARKAYGKVTVPLETLLEALQKQKASEQWKRGYIPNPATWLNQGRWEDEIQGDNAPTRVFTPTEF